MMVAAESLLFLQLEAKNSVSDLPYKQQQPTTTSVISKKSTRSKIIVKVVLDGQNFGKSLSSFNLFHLNRWFSDFEQKKSKLKVIFNIDKW